MPFPSMVHGSVRFSCWAVLTLIFIMVQFGSARAAEVNLGWGSTGADVRTVQWRLFQWGYYQGKVDGVYGPSTFAAVQHFQRKNGLPVTGGVDARTWSAMGLGTRPSAGSTPPKPKDQEVWGSNPTQVDLNLLARLVAGEARGEPYLGKVAVAAVVLNRIKNPQFPNTLSGVIYQPLAFESVANGEIWRPVNVDSQRAAREAVSGWDPTYGSLYFWNPAKATSRWIWTRQIIRRIGNHVFAR